MVPMVAWCIASSESASGLVKDGYAYEQAIRACRYLMQNLDWLDEELGDYDSDYIIIDCPGMSHRETPVREDLIHFPQSL